MNHLKDQRLSIRNLTTQDLYEVSFWNENGNPPLGLLKGKSRIPWIPWMEKFIQPSNPTCDGVIWCDACDPSGSQFGELQAWLVLLPVSWWRVFPHTPEKEGGETWQFQILRAIYRIRFGKSFRKISLDSRALSDRPLCETIRGQPGFWRLLNSTASCIHLHSFAPVGNLPVRRLNSLRYMVTTFQ